MQEKVCSAFVRHGCSFYFLVSLIKNVLIETVLSRYYLRLILPLYLQCFLVFPNFSFRFLIDMFLISKTCVRSCLTKRMMNKSCMDFGSCKRNGLLHYEHCRLNECFFTEVLSIVFSRLFFHGNKHPLQKRGMPYAR